MNKTFISSVLGIIITIAAGFTVFYTVILPKDKTDSAIETAGNVENNKNKEVNPYAPPGLDEVPDGEEGTLIKQGYKYLTETSTALDEYVGNKLTCASCHANGGYGPALDMVGVTKTYPQYIPRAGKEVTIKERINGCFKRSMNGNPLPPDGPEMKAMVAFLQYISTNVPDGTKERPWAKLKKVEGDLSKINIDEGRELYKKACITCHGEDGSGSMPKLALWGDDSYNIGAGMARVRTAAGFIKTYMPKGTVGEFSQGSLTDEQALNIAAYINSQERADFPDKIYDWPNGDAPDDVPYETLASKKKNK